eukprot:1694994-Pyramimonas_sp.AAC.1
MVAPMNAKQLRGTRPCSATNNWPEETREARVVEAQRAGTGLHADPTMTPDIYKLRGKATSSNMFLARILHAEGTKSPNPEADYVIPLWAFFLLVKKKKRNIAHQRTVMHPAWTGWTGPLPRQSVSQTCIVAPR